MNPFSTRTARAGSLAAAGVLVGAGAVVTISSPNAAAIPSTQRSCAFDQRSITTTQGWRYAGSSARIDTGNVARNVIVSFNADAGVDPASEIRLGYSIDGGKVQTPGAQNFANHTEYWQTRHSIVVISVPAGVHTISVLWRISGVPGKNGYIHGRCLTAEAYTG